MTELAAFSYSDVTPADAAWLKDKVGVIRHLARQTALSVLYLGKHLTEARERVGATAFNGWVEAEFAWKKSSAARFIAVWDRFAHLEEKKELVNRFDPSALYVLVERTTPEEARVLAVDQAERGERVTAKGAKEIMAHLRRKVDEKDYRRVRQALDRTFKGERPKAEDVTLDSKSWQAFKHLLEGGDVVRFERIDDVDGRGDPQHSPWSCTIYPCDPGAKIRQHVTADGLEALVMYLAGREELVACDSCKQLKGQFSGYSRKDGNATGRAKSCRACEVARVKKAKARKKDRVNGPSLFPDA